MFSSRLRKPNGTQIAIARPKPHVTHHGDGHSSVPWPSPSGEMNAGGQTSYRSAPFHLRGEGGVSGGAGGGFGG